MTEEMKDEKKIIGSADPVSIAGTKKILDQLINCICKIKIKEAFGTGFFCLVPFGNNEILKVLMTNYHVINEKYLKENKNINLLINDNNEAIKIDLGIERKRYLNKDCDVTLIEIREEDKINNFLELDENLFKDNLEIIYEDKSIYILQYPNGKNACVSYGLLNSIDKNDISHKCSTDNGSSGSPILNLENNKVIGIHKKGSTCFNFNLGTLLKFPINDFNEKYINKSSNKIIDETNKKSEDSMHQENNKSKNKKLENIFIGEFNIKPEDINKDIQIINSFENVKRINKWKNEKDDMKYENEKEIKENTQIKINGKFIKFSYCYKFEKEGYYIIEYSFKNNLRRTNHMFYNCNKLTNLDFSNFNTKFVTNMNSMFSYCYSLTILDLSNFDTQNVTDMNSMFSFCNSLRKLNLSNFNTKNIENMSWMFYGCKSLKNLDLTNFNTSNVSNMNSMFSFCNSITDLNLSKFNTEKVSDMNSMFSCCKSLINLNLTNFNTENVKDMNNIFSFCNSLKKKNLIAKDEKILKQLNIKN